MTEAAFTGKLKYQQKGTVKIPRVYIKNAYTGKYLSLKSLNDKSGNAIVQWSTKGAYQQWALVPVNPNKNETWYYLVNAKTNRLATSTGTGNGANVDQGVFRVESRKQVRLYKPRGVGNQYKIIFKNSNKALDVAGFSMSTGASIKQYNWNKSFG